MTQPRPPLLAIALISLATLAYEILLMRLFSIIQWHHFAYMIISLALLGYGASGAFVTLLQDRLQTHFSAVFISAISLFGITASGAFLLAQRLPFNAEEILWDALQPLWLMAMYLLLAVPFFFAASAIALALSRFSQDIGRLYAFDLLGAGLGGLFVIALLFLALPMQVLASVALVALLGALSAAMTLRTRAGWWALAILLLPGLFAVHATLDDHLILSPYKGLSQTLRISGTEVVTQRSSPLGLLSVVESHDIPLRHAPGLSLMASSEPPAQVAVFTDGDNMTVITKDTDNRHAFAYLDEMPSALPYHLTRPAHALILGAGGGAAVQQARYHDVQRITAVELNPQLVDLVKNRYGQFSGNLYDQPGVEIHIDEARGFISRSNTGYDLIQIPPMDAFGASGAGLYALNENYLYTAEAFQTYLSHLSPGGYLSISRWIRLPPRDAPKLFATALQALRDSGIKAPEQQLILIRSWQVSTLLVKNGSITSKEITALQQFCKARAFDIAWRPGMPKSEANRYNQLSQPWFYQAAIALTGNNAEAFLQDYKFNLHPASDDQPYFFHFFKWRTLPEIASLRGSGGMPLLEQGYLVLVATLLQAIVASLLLILLPLRRLRRANRNGASPWRTASYFFAVGLAFLFIEMTFIQKFILLLHHPLYAAATVMTGFLLFAAIGSGFSQRLSQRNQHKQGVVAAVIGITLLSLIIFLFFYHLPASLLALPLWIKIIISLTIIAPLAFLMGLPFPLALSHLGNNAPEMIPWAWGVNGCASVISTILATLLAMHGGFTLVITLAVGLYIVAALSFTGVDKGKNFSR
jgi:spermidine synthase